MPFDVRNLVTSSVATLRSQGPPDDQVVETFERRFAEHVGAAHCVSFAFARTAVHQALESQALPHGSEVLMPPITISPMMDAVLSLGLRPVFVDIDPNSLIFDVEAFERAITPNTRAALITYLFGIAADPTPLIEVAARAGLFVIEDFSHNLGASVGGRSLGTFGDVGVYSCSATKTLDAYGGGLAVTNSTSLAGLLRTAQRRLPHPPARRVPPKVLVDLAWNAGSHKSMWSA
ncbi:MAG: DegT/DnrJ/EryC1/StrS family aminotransferase, partial [Candidatus Microthrix parvicella]